MAGEHIGVEYLVQQTGQLELPDEESPQFEQQLDADEGFAEPATSPASPTPSDEVELESMALLTTLDDNEDSEPEDDSEQQEVYLM